MQWISIESSALMATSYIRGERLLYLRFSSGDVYKYLDFPPEKFDEFLASASKGRYFAHKIRGRFQFEPVTDELTPEKPDQNRMRRKCRHRHC